MARREMAVLALMGLGLPFAAARAADRCSEVLAALGGRVVDAACFESPDLTTHNELAAPAGPTTPADNAVAGVPIFAFTPRTDRTVISPDAPDRTPITRAVPGIQVVPTASGIEVLVRYITRANERHEARTRLYQSVLELMHGPREGSGTPASASGSAATRSSAT